MQHAVRNSGKPGVVACAISAVDIALWDLRARLLDEPLVIALGAVHDATPIYGSGGFTSYDNKTLCAQLCGWAEAGIPARQDEGGPRPGGRHRPGRRAALCDARGMDLSLHCAPQISGQVGTAVWHLRHLEYFHDHVRIEGLAFDGTLGPEPGGVLRPDRGAPGHGLTVKFADLERYRVA